MAGMDRSLERCDGLALICAIFESSSVLERDFAIATLRNAGIGDRLASMETCDKVEFRLELVHVKTCRSAVWPSSVSPNPTDWQTFLL